MNYLFGTPETLAVMTKLEEHPERVWCAACHAKVPPVIFGLFYPNEGGGPYGYGLCRWCERRLRKDPADVQRQVESTIRSCLATGKGML